MEESKNSGLSQIVEIFPLAQLGQYDKFNVSLNQTNLGIIKKFDHLVSKLRQVGLRTGTVDVNPNQKPSHEIHSGSFFGSTVLTVAGAVLASHQLPV